MADIYLVGAGPGDPGLLTVRAKELIESADVIVYDYLANAVFLEYAKKGAKIIYVGKKGGSHTMAQEDINALLVDLAGKHKTLVRLKGGDPYVFGRGAEEAEELIAAGLSFEVVPGVTAGVAAPAYAGIPVTHREHTTSVCFITGHEDPTKEKSGHNWEVYAKSTSTLVFYMGVGNLPMIAEKLMAGGRDPKTPTALVRWGTRNRQESMAAPLHKVAEEAKVRGFKAPSIIIVGTVCSLGEKLSWFENRPLFGKGVIVTRAREQASGFATSLQKLGARVLQYPTITINPLPDYTAVHKAIKELENYHWLIFTSVNGVRLFWQELAHLGQDTRSLGKCKVAAIGPATAGALQKRGILPDFVPEKYVAESVLAGLMERGVGQGSRILIPRAKKAREVLPKELIKKGAKVDILPVYETTLCTDKQEEIAEALDKGIVDYITFTSSSTVDNFFTLIPADTLKKHSHVRLASIGPITTKTLEQYGFSPHIEPEDYTIPGLIEALCAD